MDAHPPQDRRDDERAGERAVPPVSEPGDASDAGAAQGEAPAEVPHGPDDLIPL